MYDLATTLSLSLQSPSRYGCHHPGTVTVSCIRGLYLSCHIQREFFLSFFLDIFLVSPSFMGSIVNNAPLSRDFAKFLPIEAMAVLWTFSNRGLFMNIPTISALVHFFRLYLHMLSLFFLLWGFHMCTQWNMIVCTTTTLHLLPPSCSGIFLWSAFIVEPCTGLHTCGDPQMPVLETMLPLLSHSAVLWGFLSCFVWQFAVISIHVATTTL